jgi:hypothetical protein
MIALAVVAVLGLGAGIAGVTSALAGTTGATIRAGAFAHPGVLASRSQLDFVKAKVNAGAQPWKRAYDQMMSHPLASQSREPNPRATVECGSYSNPNNGCTDERQDALAAYANAVAWYITGDSRYANKAISIMNAWSAVIRNHTNSNAPLQAAWAGSTWPRAAEIIRYTYNGWAPADIDRFSTMLRTVYLPVVIKGSGGNGNWELSMMEAATGIAVFLDDRTNYSKAITRFEARVPAYVYLTSDGSYPKSPPGTTLTQSQTVSFWHGQGTFVDGLSQETCRDFVHTGYGLTAIAHVAETARIQGDDLYPQVKARLAAALELHASFELGAAVPSWLCGGSVQKGLGPATEVAYNALGNRLGMSLPNTKTLTQSRRPAQTNVLFVGWDTLTHADNPG